MRQVPENPAAATGCAKPLAGASNPPTYALLGNGRLARHLRHYFAQLGLSVVNWSRCGQPEANTFASIADPQQRLTHALKQAEVALVLFSDDAIAPFIEQHSAQCNATGEAIRWVHCAASVQVSGAFCAHPLMTFSSSLYPLKTYQSIGFACDNRQRYRQLFPALPNPTFEVASSQRSAYHALCVMTGNFPQMLWQHCLQEFQKLGVPAAAVQNYLQQVSTNFLLDPSGALTGPLVRGDTDTVRRHRQTLPQINPSLADLYAAFVRFFESGQAKPSIAPQSSPKNTFATTETSHEHS